MLLNICIWKKKKKSRLRKTFRKMFSSYARKSDENTFFLYQSTEYSENAFTILLLLENFDTMLYYIWKRVNSEKTFGNFFHCLQKAMKMHFSFINYSQKKFRACSYYFKNVVILLHVCIRKREILKDIWQFFF